MRSMHHTFFIILTAIFSLSSFGLSQAQAASDSVSVFHRDEKVVVVINEWASSQPRLPLLIQAIAPGESNFRIASRDGSFKGSCAYGQRGATCNFTFTPSKVVEFASSVRAVRAHMAIESEDAEVYFESSVADVFRLKIKSGILTVYASKRQ